MVRRYDIPRALVLIFVVSLATTAEGQVPTSADFAACNEEAPKTIKAGTASPTTGDRARADNLPADAKTFAVPYGGGKAIESPDPQIHGMSAEGATNAFYQAAYRSCMRRKGF
jgi:hypothetical protein